MLSLFSSSSIVTCYFIKVLEAATGKSTTFPQTVKELSDIFVRADMKPPTKSAMNHLLALMKSGSSVQEFLEQKQESLIPKSKKNVKAKNKKVKTSRHKTFSHNIPRTNKGSLVSKAKAKAPPPLRNTACSKGHVLCLKLRSNKPSSIIREMGCNVPVMDNDTREKITLIYYY